MVSSTMGVPREVYAELGVVPSWSVAPKLDEPTFFQDSLVSARHGPMSHKNVLNS